MIKPEKKGPEAAIALVKSWLADKSGYDERVWPRLAREIERNRLSYRKRLEPEISRNSRRMTWLGK